jgi:hypothetical protein
MRSSDPHISIVVYDAYKASQLFLVCRFCNLLNSVNLIR